MGDAAVQKPHILVVIHRAFPGFMTGEIRNEFPDAEVRFVTPQVGDRLPAGGCSS
jgi:hypothetical protein